MNKEELESRLNSVKNDLNGAVLVAVSKYSPVEDVALAYSLGQLDFGENRVSELTMKAGSFQFNQRQNVRWHFIGTLQTNKVKELLKIPNLWAIHSVSSKKLLEEIIRREAEITEPELNLFFQLNTSKEEEKSGFDTVEEIAEAIELLHAKKKSNLVCYGLMTMGSIREENFEEAARKSFKELKAARDYLADKFSLPNLKLSMGMSQDYKIALEEGADFIRVGSLIFKE
jgi:pyridoxal phosphate enzyme (YggS family)